MDQLRKLYIYEIRIIAKDFEIKGRAKMNKQELIDEITKHKDEEIADLIEKVALTSRIICDHGKIKKFCSECNGYNCLLHNKYKYHCKECGGSQICVHNKQKQHCKECGGSHICRHNKQKQQCVECVGSQICEHDKQKSSCKDCRMKLFYDLK